MADRRRLTVSKCDPVKPRSPRGKSAQKSLIAETVEELKKSVKSGSVYSVCSKTDRDLARRGSFQTKDEEAVGLTGDDAGKESEEVKKRGIGWKCNKGMKPESPNQDSFAMVIAPEEFELFGVFDGHGPMGHFVSDIAREVLVQKFMMHKDRESNTGEAFIDAFVNTQKFLESDEVTKTRKVDTSNSGSTCTMAYYSRAKGDITIAHVGDSRSVLAGTKSADKARSSYEYIEDLTVDHKPNLPEEKARIESSNPPGRVVFDGYYNHRVFAQSAMYPGLNMSRALGDVVAHKEAGLTAKPDIKVINLAEHKAKGYVSLALLVCSDGVWEFIESPEAVKMVMKEPGNGEAADVLAKTSYNRWMEDSEGEISDDITCIILEFPL